MQKESYNAKPFGGFERSMAWRYLRAKRQNGGASLIAVISFVGIALATYALIVVMSVMGGFRTILLETLLGGQPHISVNLTGYAAEDVERFAQEIRAIDGVERVIPGVEQAVIASHQGQTAFAQVRGIRLDDLSQFPYIGQKELLESLGFDEGEKGGDGLILGYRLAQKLGLYPGAKITLIASQARRSTVLGAQPRSKTYTVLGAFNSGVVTIDELGIFMPLSQAQIFFKAKDQIPLLDIRLDEPANSRPTAYKIVDISREYDVAFPDGIDISDWQQAEAGRLNALAVERSMMRLILLVLVMVTALNIITGVVMLVKNKTRDIAILRTMGLSRGGIMRIFVMIGAFLGLVGAGIGLGLGLLTIANIGVVEALLNFMMGAPVFDPETYGIDGLPARIEWGEVAIASVFAFIMSGIVTLIPAWGAARLDPVKALRFE